MRLLLVKETMGWPRSSGNDVHSYHLLRALARRGHEVGLLTASEPAAEALAGLPLAFRRTLPAGGGPDPEPPPRLGWLRRKFRGFWGVAAGREAAVARAADDMRADAVVSVALSGLLELAAVRDRVRVWYPADERAWHHASQVWPLRPRTWGGLRSAAVEGLYERACRPLVDRVWVVTDTDRRAMRLVAGGGGIDVVPNGVDAEHFAPLAVPQRERSCTFWGRLDFGPNVQALEWFCGKVWPLVRREVPDATFTVYGFNPTPPVAALAGRDGVELVPGLPDLRESIAAHPVVAFPFVSGGGIKNKFLEAAAMAKPAVCTRVALNGLRHPEECGAAVARAPGEWARLLADLWSDPAARAARGAAARAWVTAHHSWDAAARVAEEGLEKSLADARRGR
jgi:glycosyltransferase involved in cell wall biosynthesis